MTTPARDTADTAETAETAETPHASEPGPPVVSPTPARPARPAPKGLLSATAVIATVGVVVSLIGLALMFRPVSTPTQDCGTTIAFLLEGRVNELVNEGDLPKGVTLAEAKANNAEPCRERVADAVKPAAVLFGAGMVAAVGAALTEVVVRSTAWLRRRRVAPSPAP